MVNERSQKSVALPLSKTCIDPHKNQQLKTTLHCVMAMTPSDRLHVAEEAKG